MKSKMRTLFLAIAVALTAPLVGQGSASTLPKSIVGYWQQGSAETSDARPNCYRFFNDGKFSFEFSQYEETKRILSLHGTYQVKDETVHLVVTHRIERQGGSIVWNPQARYGWSIEGGKSVKVLQPNSQEEEIGLEACPPTGKRICLIIGGDKYTQVSTNPKTQ